MTKKIYGGWDVTNNVTANGNRTVQSINGELFDTDGHMTIEGYSNEELQEIIGVLPLSHYGTHNYLPAGVSGDFVGASNNSSYRRVKILLEDDGTLVVLRPGTNGSSMGLYYSYLSNAMETSDMNTFINTTRQYRASYFQPDLYAVSTISSDENIVCGNLKSYSTGNISSLYFTSFTNGTLDDTQHTGYLLDYAEICPTGGSLKYVFLGNGNYVYYISYIENSTYRCDLTIVRALYNSSTNTVSTQELTGYNGSLFTTMPNSSRTIKIAGASYSRNIADTPYMLVNGTNIINYTTWSVDLDVCAAQNKTSNVIRIRINGDGWATTTTYSDRPQHGFSFTLELGGLVCTVDPEYVKTPAPLVVTDTGSEIISTGNIITNTSSLYWHRGYRNIANTYQYLTDYNTIFSITTPNLGQAPLLQKATYTQTGESNFNLMNFFKYPATITQVGSMYSTYGSVITNNLAGLELLPNNALKVSAEVQETYGARQLCYSQYGATLDYAYTSIQYGNIVGYAPSVNRHSIPFNNDNLAFISTISGSTVQTNGGVLIQGIRHSTPLSYDGNATPSSQRISIDDTVFLNFKNSELAKFTEQVGSNSVGCTLYVPQKTDIPVMALISGVNPNTNRYHYRLVEVSTNTRTGNITSVTFSRLVIESTETNNIWSPTTGTSFQQTATGLTIYDAGSFYFIGGCEPLIRNVPGNSCGYVWSTIVQKSTQQNERFFIRGLYFPYQLGSQPFALPNVGFGYTVATDATTRIVFIKVGTTIADYDAWTQQGQVVSVISQDVAKGFIMYFTEDTPVMLSGKSFTMPVQSIDLTTIKANPANSTFHVYVRMEQGLAKYFVTENVIAESGTSAYNVLWIGTISTNENQIDRINIIKRSRLDVYSASLTAAGSSFPVSYGLPTAPGTISW